MDKICNALDAVIENKRTTNMFEEQTGVRQGLSVFTIVGDGKCVNIQTENTKFVDCGRYRDDLNKELEWFLLIGGLMYMYMHRVLLVT